MLGHAKLASWKTTAIVLGYDERPIIREAVHRGYTDSVRQQRRFNSTNTKDILPAVFQVLYTFAPQHARDSPLSTHASHLSSLQVRARTELRTSTHEKKHNGMPADHTAPDSVLRNLPPQPQACCLTTVLRHKKTLGMAALLLSFQVIHLRDLGRAALQPAAGGPSICHRPQQRPVAARDGHVRDVPELSEQPPPPVGVVRKGVRARHLDRVRLGRVDLHARRIMRWASC